ncbi:LysM peptidoglycan-binding domain-containing protein [Micromonospora sp. NBC_01813]|uniref:LysM peptidoglycan-binding domain-containing protein n=1 Tax=Micromonospora sp. NBC_01813 TaxID=2975988 RepID=UPI002DDB79B4|nr:hypothetical protein [Micromonospora sp. NBC_01813]WSA07520.1 hypothetical protein OG958_25215 [Micromonospora sp. NBC_01813]
MSVIAPGRGDFAVAPRALLVVLRALLVVLMALIGVGTVPAPAGAAETVEVKVYVVPPGASRDESLPAIAERTLGDPGRAGEIFELNRSRPQPDGFGLTQPSDLPRPGWVLQLPEDAAGPDVRTGRVAAPGRPYWNIKLVLSLIGCVVIGTGTGLFLARRRVGGWVRRTVGQARQARALRRRRAALLRRRGELAVELTADAVLPAVVGRGVGELTGSAAAANTEVYAVLAGTDGLRAWLSSPARPPVGWTSEHRGHWHRDVTTTDPAVSYPADDRALLVRVGGTADGTLFADLSWLDGVLSVAGDPAVAADAVAALLLEVARQRPHLPVVSVGPVPDPRLVPAGAHRVERIADLREVVRAAAPARAGSVVLRDAARRRRLAGLMVLCGPLDESEAGQLVELCSSECGDWAAVVSGPVPGAHWRWQARPDGTMYVANLGQAVTVAAVASAGGGR